MPEVSEYKDCDNCAVYMKNCQHYDDDKCPICKWNWHLDDFYEPYKKEAE
jgi:hypothetical protein